MAVRTDRIAAIAAQKNAHVKLVFLSFQPFEKSIDAVVAGLGFTFDHQILLFRGEVPKGNIGRNIFSSREFLQLIEQNAIARRRPWLNRALVQ